MDSLTMDSVIEALMKCKALLPETFAHAHERLFHKEHLEKLAARLCDFHHHGVPEKLPPPYLTVECTPPLKEVFAPFLTFWELWDKTGDKNSTTLLQKLADSLTDASSKNILVLLGQRLTPASITDARAIPLPKEQLIGTFSQIYSSKLTTGARAWTKHVNRNGGNFWGKVEGSDEDKNESARQIIQKILDNATWWNIFWHYKHQIVYESRVAEGYGARWGKDGQEFIGFLEPFTPGFPEVRDLD